jgi:chromosome segregation ATPase
MTTLGKLLVFANTFLAVLLAGWAVSLYVNRVDWFDRTSEEAKIEGQFTQLGTEIKKLSEQVKLSQLAFANAARRAENAELNRDFRKQVLTARLNGVRKIDDTVKFHEPVREARSSLLDPAKLGPTVKNINNEDLRGLGSLQATYKDQLEKTLSMQGQILKLRKEYDTMTDDYEKIQIEIIKQKVIRDNLADEQDYLADSLINWEERLRTLELRKAQLQNRLTALGAGSAGR